jgi:hypothetical protein
MSAPQIMSTMIDESFSQHCSVLGGDSTLDYGYGDTATNTAKLGCESTHSNDLGYASTHSNSEYGYGDDNDQQQEQQRRRERPRRRGSITKYSLDAQQEVQQEFQRPPDAPVEVKEIHFDPTSMGYGEAVVSPNYDPPTPIGQIRKSRKSKQLDTSDAADTSNTSADKYDHGNTSNTPPDKYDYERSDNNDQQQEEQQRRRERPRRRGSITKYSLDAQQEVQQEFQHPPDAPAEVEEIHFDPTSMGYGEAVVSLNYDPPTPIGQIRKSRKSKQLDTSDAADTSNTSADKYGDGDTSNTSPDKYDYGNTSNTPADKYGYGGSDDGQQQEQQRRRERPRRRGSITKYSLDAQQEVQQEFQQLSAAPAEVEEIHFDPTIMGYGEAVVSLNYDPPTPIGQIRKSRKSKQLDSSDAASNTSADKYGYGDSISNTSAYKYGYGDTSDLGDGDSIAHGSTASGQSADSQRHRPRRRGSITKYSLEATETVANEYHDQEQAAPVSLPPQQEYKYYTRPISTEDSISYDGSKSCDGSSMSHNGDDGDAEDGKKKKKKGRLFSRLRIERNSSRSSKDSASKDSN